MRQCTEAMGTDIDGLGFTLEPAFECSEEGIRDDKGDIVWLEHIEGHTMRLPQLGAEYMPVRYMIRDDDRCESNLDLVRLIEKYSKVNHGYAILTAVNDDREQQYLWRWETPPQVSKTPNISQVSQGRAGIIIYDV